MEEKRVCSRHKVLLVILLMIALPLLICFGYILMIGVYCIVRKYTNYIEQCSIFISSENVTTIVLYGSCISQMIMNISSVMVLGVRGLKTCSHMYIKYRSKKRLNLRCCGRNLWNCSCLRVWIFYWSVTILIQIQSYWEIGVLEKKMVLAALTGTAVITNTIQSMTLLPEPMGSVMENVESGYISDQDQIYDSNRTDMIKQTRYGSSESLSTNMRLLEDSETPTNYFCCSYNYKVTFFWAPIVFFLSFYYNSCFLVYDLMRLAIWFTSPSNHSANNISTFDPYSHTKLFLSIFTLGYRFYHANCYMKKWMSMEAINTPLPDQKNLISYSQVTVNDSDNGILSSTPITFHQGGNNQNRLFAEEED